MAMKRKVGLVLALFVATQAVASRLVFNQPGAPPTDPKPTDPAPPQEDPVDADQADAAGAAEVADEADAAAAADQGVYGDEADEADEAAHADEADGATEGAAAASIAACAGGPWLDGSCGDLSGTGPVGIGLAPQADLDVLGNASLAGLSVLADGRVAISGAADPDGALLTVAGPLVASAFRTPEVRLRAVQPHECLTLLKTGSYLDETGLWSPTIDSFHCPVPLPVGATPVSVTCQVTDNELGHFHLIKRQWDDESVFVPQSVRIDRSNGWTTQAPGIGEVEDGDVVWLQYWAWALPVGVTKGFHGCTVGWTYTDV